MSKKGLIKAYEELAQMYIEDKKKVKEIWSEFENDYDDGYDYDEDGNIPYYELPAELEESDGNLQVILEAARKRSRDREEQIKFTINAIATNRDKVTVSYDTFTSVLDILPDESKLDELLDKYNIVPSGYQDVDAAWLGTTFKQAGKSLDELPEQMLTDKCFMEAYLTATEEKNKEFLNQGYMDWPEDFFD